MKRQSAVGTREILTLSCSFCDENKKRDNEFEKGKFNKRIFLTKKKTSVPRLFPQSLLTAARKVQIASLVLFNPFKKERRGYEKPNIACWQNIRTKRLCRKNATYIA